MYQSFILGIVIVAGVFPCAAQQRRVAYAEIDPKDVRLKLEQLSPAPLPFQAVRLRMSIENGSSKRLGPVRSPDSPGAIKSKGPDDADYRESRAGFWPNTASGLLTVPPRREYFSLAVPLDLEPGERLSMSLAFAGEWMDADGKWFTDHAAKPVFPKPGKYWIKCYYRVAHRSETREEVGIEKTIEIEVREPKGDDKEVYEVLQKDGTLACMVMSPVHVPDINSFMKLKRLLDRFPGSDYADYIRFALARAYMNQIGVSPPSSRVAYALAADELEKLGCLRYDWAKRRFFPCHFAYQPNALILLKRTDLRSRESALLQLHEQFPDALEWIEELARLMSGGDGERFEELKAVLKKPYPDLEERANDPQAVSRWMAGEWQAFRKRRPVDPNEKPPGK